MKNEEDKFRKEQGRRAARKENDSQYLNDKALDDDLIDTDTDDTEDGEGIINSEHPENQEWNVRENENR